MLVSADGRQKADGFLRSKITSTNNCKVIVGNIDIVSDLSTLFAVLIPNVYSMVMSFSEED